MTPAGLIGNDSRRSPFMAKPTMNMRRLLLLCLPVSLAALGLAAWLLWPRTAITPENAEKVQRGMTLAEVEAILGGPARDDATGPLTSDLSEAVESYDRPGRLKWQSDQTVVWV